MSNKVKKPKIKKTKPKKVSLSQVDGKRKNLIVYAVGAIVTVAFALAIFVGLSATFSTESYYVLTQDVPAKTQITADIVVEQETAKGTAPSNALSMSEIQQGGLYARYPLYRGDVIASSNVGPASDTSLGIPDDWSVTSFNISSSDAVGGVLGRGEYVDIIGVNDDGARYIFNNVLVLDATFSSQELSNKDEQTTVIDELVHYTVGMPAEDVAILHSALHDYDNIKVVKAPANVRYNQRDVSGLDRSFKFGPGVGNKDLLEGSDPSFSEVIRDERGVPINESTCGSKLTDDEETCNDLGFPYGINSDSEKPKENEAVQEEQKGTEEIKDDKEIEENKEKEEVKDEE